MALTQALPGFVFPKDSSVARQARAAKKAGTRSEEGRHAQRGLAPDTKLASDSHNRFRRLRQPMPLHPPAQAGQRFSEIDTPALVLDLDAFERNLVAMAAYTQAHGVRLRPHAKTHKSPEIALRQIAHGAVGQCCQKVSEAEVLVAGGVQDVLVSNEVAGAAKLDRLAQLARSAKISLCVDHLDGVRVAA
jgi:hypothetical protein